MLTVHHLGVSQSERIVWLCEELEIPYTLKLYKRDPMMAPADYKALHPLGTAPIITDGELALAESAAIIEYVVHQYGGGRLIPKPGSPNWTDYLFWFHFANGSLMPAMMIGMVMSMAGVTPDSPVGQAMLSRRDTAIAMLDQRLRESNYLAGPDFTAADIMNVFPFGTGQAFMPNDLSKLPGISSYMQRIAARPGYRRAMQKAEA